VKPLLFLIFVVGLLLPAPAGASTSQESLFQDDNALLYSTAPRREQTLDELKALGVDTIRSNLLWNWVAPKPQSKRRPRGFNASDPAAYHGSWVRFDDLARGAAARGIALQFTLTGPVPAWASLCNGSVKVRHVCRPDPREFGRFATAVARRYSGDYEGLPRVSRWSIWNEPNQAGWLYPQLSRQGGAVQPEAPWRYRDLAYAGIGALRANGHAKDMILLGETAPLGRRFGSPGNLNMAPVPFWRAVLCMDARGRPLRGGAAKALRCRHFKQLQVTGAAHHPYTRAGAGSPTSPIGPDDVTLPYLGRLTREIDRARHLRRIPSRLPIYLTEYGFQTNPPDRSAGVSPSRAARWLNQSDWIAYNNRRVRSVAQYELRDERSLGGFQTGLRYRDGRAKPGLAAYRLPLWVTLRRGRTTVWGQARAGGRGDRVDLLYQARAGGGWRRFKTVRITNLQGYFRVLTRRRAHRWRISWSDAGRKQLSRAARATAG
jgi:hypothetical protein